MKTERFMDADNLNVSAERVKKIYELIDRYKNMAFNEEDDWRRGQIRNQLENETGKLPKDERLYAEQLIHKMWLS